MFGGTAQRQKRPSSAPGTLEKAIYEDISWLQNRGFSTPLPGLANLNCPALVRIPQHGCAGDKVKSGNLSGEAASLGLREDGHLDAAVVHQRAGQLSFLRGDQFALFEGAHKSCLEVGIDICNLQELLIVKRRRGANLILKGISYYRRQFFLKKSPYFRITALPHPLSPQQHHLREWSGEKKKSVLSLTREYQWTRQILQQSYCR